MIGSSARPAGQGAAAVGARVVGAIIAAAGTAILGSIVVGGFNATPDPNGVPSGMNGFMVVLAVALLVGFAGYALVEWLQTRRLDSIARQLSTRTIVLMAVAIPINIVLGQVVASALKIPVYLDSIGTILVGVLAGPIAGAATGLLSNLAWTFVLAGTPFGSPFAWPFAIVAAEVGLVAGLVGYVGGFRSRPHTPLPQLLAGAAMAAAVLTALVVGGILPFYEGLCAEGQIGPCFQFLAPGDTTSVVFRALGIVALAVVGVALLGVAIRFAGRRDVGVVIVLVAGAACGVISALIAAPIAALVFGGVTGSGTDLLVAMFLQAGADLQTAVLQQALISDSIDKAISYVIVFTLIAGMSRRLVARFPQGERVVAREA